MVLAVPVVAASTYCELRGEVDEIVALMMPKRFYGVGEWYEDFSQTSDAEVTDLLKRAKSWKAASEITNYPASYGFPFIAQTRPKLFRRSTVLRQVLNGSRSLRG